MTFAMISRNSVRALCGGGLLIAGCGHSVPSAMPPAAYAVAAASKNALSCSPTLDPLPIGQVRFFGYQIQKIDAAGAVGALKNSRYDTLVIEPTRTDWSSGNKYWNTCATVNALNTSPAHDGVHSKLVLAYVDIGEAENWRWYWTWSKTWKKGQPKPRGWPSYIVEPDPQNWGGNFPVAFWDPDWQKIIIYGMSGPNAPYKNYNSAIDEAIKDGFDGIYIDWVEAFSDPHVAARAAREHIDPAVAMIQFIQEMRDYAKQRNPKFIIVQQDASNLADNHPELYGKIDAISQEAIWYDGVATDKWKNPRGHDVLNPIGLTNWYLTRLTGYQAHGVPVFDVEYALTHAADAYGNAAGHGFVGYSTRRSLSKLTTTQPPGY
jgi:cysteinyl-tRNA synthetase